MKKGGHTTKKPESPESQREEFLRRLSEEGNMMRKPGELPHPYERARVQPTVYELAQLAIALRGGAAAEKPKEAVQDAMKVWGAAGREVHHMIARHLLRTVHGINPDMAPQPEMRTQFNLAELDGTPIKCTKAWEWVNINLRASYKFGAYKAFQRAWEEYEKQTGTYRFWSTINDLRQFVEYHTGKKRAEEMEKQRKRRAKRKSSNKFSAGQPAKSKGTKH